MCRSMENKALGFQSCKRSSKQRFVISKAVVKAEYSQVYRDEWLPEEYEKCMVGLTAILREAWTTSQQTDESREKIQALSLAKECYSMKLKLLTDTTVVDDSIKFVSSDRKKTKGDKIASTTSSDTDAKELTSTTIILSTNQVF